MGKTPYFFFSIFFACARMARQREGTLKVTPVHFNITRKVTTLSWNHNNNQIKIQGFSPIYYLLYYVIIRGIRSPFGFGQI